MSKLAINQGNPQFIPLTTYRSYAEDEMHQRAQAFYQDLARRKTVREFQSKPVPREVIEQCLLAAGTAPSGANHQPWHFAVVSDPALKSKIRIEAEIEEREFYERRAPQWSAEQQAQAAQAATDGSVWCFSSSQAIAHLARALPDQNWAEARCIATHDRIAEAAQALGFSKIQRARPSVADVLRSLECLA